MIACVVPLECVCVCLPGVIVWLCDCLQHTRAVELLHSELSEAVRRGKDDKERLLELLSVKSDELTRLSAKV